MKVLAAVAAVFSCYLSASGYCVTVIPEPRPSARNARVTVLRDEKPQEGAKITVALPDGRGFRSLVTDSHGTATLENLPAGTSCVRAIGEEHFEAALCLAVSENSNSETNSFVLTLTDTLPPPPPIGSAPPDLFRQLDLVVQDPSGGAISNAEVWVYARQSYPTSALVKARTDQGGRLVVPVNPGSYAVLFRSAGFKAFVRAIEISPNGSVGPVREVLQVGGC